MYYFYIIESMKDNSYYYGSTENLQKRLLRHNSGTVKSTKSKIPYKVIYYEAYQSLLLAKKREYNVKRNWAAKEEIKKRIM